MSICQIPRASLRHCQNSTRVWTSSAQRSSIPTEPCYGASFSFFVSVGYYPARGYQPLAEFGGAKKLPLLLDAQQLQTLAENIASLCNALCANEHFSKKDGDLKMNTTGSYRIARVYLGKQYLSFTYEELRNLAYNMYAIQNQLTLYTAAMTDVIAYIDTAQDSVAFIEPSSTANKSINYYQLFEETKSVLTV